jgi:sugar phosphate isomerase/epimerase
MTWRLGVATGCNVNVPIASTLDVFADAGVTAVEISTPPRHFDPWESACVPVVAGQLHRLHIEPVSIHAPFGGPSDLSDPRPERRHAAIGGAVAAASTLRQFGGAHVIVHTTDVVRDGHDVGERLRHCADSLRVLARVCEQMGVRLVVETPLPHLIGGQPDEFAWILEQLDERVGVCIDTGHVFLGAGWHRFAEVAGRRLVHIHASDNRGQFDDHLAPGDGSIDWHPIRESLRAMNFDGCVVLELASAGIPAAPEISRALQCARNLLW